MKSPEHARREIGKAYRDVLHMVVACHLELLCAILWVITIAIFVMSMPFCLSAKWLERAVNDLKVRTRMHL